MQNYKKKGFRMYKYPANNITIIETPATINYSLILKELHSYVT